MVKFSEVLFRINNPGVIVEADATPGGDVAKVHDDSGETVSHVPGVPNTPAGVKKLRGDVLAAVAKKTGHSKNTVKEFQDQIDSEGPNHAHFSGTDKEAEEYHEQKFRNAAHYIQHHSDIGADQLGKK